MPHLRSGRDSDNPHRSVRLSFVMAQQGGPVLWGVEYSQVATDRMAGANDQNEDSRTCRHTRSGSGSLIIS